VTGRPRLVELDIAEDPAAWRALGLDVGDDGRCRVGTTDLVLRGGAGGIAGWTLEGAMPGPDGIDGLPTCVGAAGERPAGAAHPNGVVGIDHVVVATPDTARTFAALEAAGLELRRTREAGTPQRPLRQGFLPLREALVEVVGPAEPEGDRPARFWGLTLVVGDLDATAGRMGAALGAIRDAVQPGRRIATVRREAGLGVPLALMTPRP
jgi:hypothetical protein